MHLPNGDRAEAEPNKLRDHCRNPQHPRGRHRARVFADPLGLTAREATWPRAALLRAAREDGTLVADDADLHGRSLCDTESGKGPLRGPAMPRARWTRRVRSQAILACQRQVWKP